MTITTTKTLCDVTGKEVPTKVVVAPIHASMFGATEYVNQRFDLSHDGAIKTIERLLVYANRCGEDTPKVVGRVLNNLREKVTAGVTIPAEPLNGSEPLTWHFSDKAMRVHDSKIRNEAYSLGCEISVREYNDELDKARKQAARECLEIVKAVLSNGDSSSRHPALLGDFITTDITKAFGL